MPSAGYNVRKAKIFIFSSGNLAQPCPTLFRGGGNLNTFVGNEENRPLAASGDVFNAFFL